MPDLPERIVGRAVAIPHHMGDDRRAAIGDDDHGQAVVEAEIDDARAGRRARGARRGGVEMGLEESEVIDTRTAGEEKRTFHRKRPL